MNIRPIKVAVIGVGSMGKNHARVFSELPEADLLAVTDSNSIAADRVAGEFAVHAYQDYRQMLAIEQPEAVSIAVPTAMHEEVGLAALEAGVHVLIEKPIAATLDSGKRLIECAASQGRLLMVGHIVRFNPAIQSLKEKLIAGDLGRIFQVICRRAGPFPARIRDVGVVVDLAPHDLDLMRYLVGSDPIRIYAETEQRIRTDQEDLLLGLLRFPGGVIGALEINWLTPTKVREVVVLGERGMFRVDDLTQDLYFYESPSAFRQWAPGDMDQLWPALLTLKGVSEGSLTRFAIDRYEPLKAELRSFLDAIRTGVPAPVSGSDGLAALRLALALVEAGKTHRVIDL